MCTDFNIITRSHRLHSVSFILTYWKLMFLFDWAYWEHLVNLAWNVLWGDKEWYLFSDDQKQIRMGEDSIETCIFSYVKYFASPGLMHETGYSGLVHWDDPEGWGGRWEGVSRWGTHVHPWLIHVNVCQKTLQYCKVISLQLNKLILKKEWGRKQIGMGKGICHF